MKTLSAFLLFFFSAASFGQGGLLMLHGRVENNSVLLKDVTIEVVKDNEIVDEFINNKHGSYKYRFALGSIYNISITIEGYITKTVGVIAQPPDSLIIVHFFCQLDIDSFQRNEGIA